MEDIKNLFLLLQITPKNEDVYLEACTHRSYVHEKKEVSKNNERIEFLGDAVLEIVVTDFLFRKFPDEQEGVLTSIRAALVNTNNLAKVALKLGIGRFLKLGRGEELSGGRHKDHLLANMVESIIGALYLDLGYDSSKKFIEDNIFPTLDHILKEGLYKDPKSELQEIIQERLSITPKYEMISSEGPDHEKTFTMGLFFGDKLITIGIGASKREGEENAAKKALKNKVWEE